MKVSTTLQEISYTQQSREQREISKEEEQKEKKLYYNFVKETIQDNLYYIFEKEKDTQEAYNKIIVNDILSETIREIDTEAQEHYTITTDYVKDKKSGEWIKKRFGTLLWNNFINYNEIRDIFYKILDKTKKEYERKDIILNNYLLETLKNEIENIYLKNPYNIVHDNCYKYGMDHEMAQFYAKKSSDYLLLKNNYYKILDKIDMKYKKISKCNGSEQTKTTRSTPTRKNKNIIQRHAGLIMTTGLISGLAKGFKEASK